MNLFRLSIASCFITVFALTAGGCAMDASSASPDDRSSGPPSLDASAGSFAPCTLSSQCEAHNHVCVYDGAGASGHCAPPEDGLCVPMGSSTTHIETDCYPGATCVPVPASLSPRGGMCSFANAPGEVFRVPGAPKIALIDPTPFNEYSPSQALTLRWTPPTGLRVDTTTVTVVLKRPPQRVPDYNRLRNIEDIVWIWASSEPGGATEGAVSLRAGHRGLRSDGTLGPPFNADTLPRGRYWWMTYTLRDGVVHAASDAFTFRVGDDFNAQACANNNTCIALIPGETSDRVACVAGRCRRRCASDLDCPGARLRCDLATPVSTPVSTPGDAGVLPRGAFCVERD